MIDKTHRFRIGDKVKFGYSWLLPKALHHKLCRVTSLMGVGNEGDHIDLVVEDTDAQLFIRESHLRRAGTLTEV